MCVLELTGDLCSSQTTAVMTTKQQRCQKSYSLETELPLEGRRWWSWPVVWGGCRSLAAEQWGVLGCCSIGSWPTPGTPYASKGQSDPWHQETPCSPFPQTDAEGASSMCRCPLLPLRLVGCAQSQFDMWDRAAFNSSHMYLHHYLQGHLVACWLKQGSSCSPPPLTAPSWRILT